MADLTVTNYRYVTTALPLITMDQTGITTARRISTRLVGTSHSSITLPWLAPTLMEGAKATASTRWDALARRNRVPQRFTPYSAVATSDITLQRTTPPRCCVLDSRVAGFWFSRHMTHYYPPPRILVY